MKQIILIGCCLAMLAGCSGKPSESFMANQVNQKIHQKVGVEFVQIENFVKINGREEGDRKYLADVEYDIVFTKGPGAVAKDKSAKWGKMQLQMLLGSFKKGGKKHIKASLLFAQSENGWVLVN